MNRMHAKSAPTPVSAVVTAAPARDALKDIDKLEDSLWEVADSLRANSKLTSSEYCMPVLRRRRRRGARAVQGRPAGFAERQAKPNI